MAAGGGWIYRSLECSV